MVFGKATIQAFPYFKVLIHIGIEEVSVNVGEVEADP